MRRSVSNYNWNIKQCACCGKLKDHQHFGFVGKKGCRKGLRGKCSVCHKDFMNRKYDSYKSRQRNKVLTDTYGIDLETYNKMLVQQGGVCKICKKKDKHQNLAVDHDHKTGKVRGLLCCMCNRGLGNFYDNTQYLSEAITYLMTEQAR